MVRADNNLSISSFVSKYRHLNRIKNFFVSPEKSFWIKNRKKIQVYLTAMYKTISYLSFSSGLEPGIKFPSLTYKPGILS